MQVGGGPGQAGMAEEGGDNWEVAEWRKRKKSMQLGPENV